VGIIIACCVPLTALLARTPLAVPLTGRRRVPWHLPGWNGLPDASASAVRRSAEHLRLRRFYPREAGGRADSVMKSRA